MKENNNKGLPIFYRLLFSFLGVVIITCGILTTVFYVFSKKSLENYTRERISQQFETIDHHFSHELKYELERELRILASDPILDEFMTSSDLDREINARLLERLFLQHLHYMEGFQSIYFVDYSGKELVKVVSAGPVKQYRDLSKSKLFAQIESNTQAGISIEGSFKGENGKTLLSIGISKADVDIGKFGGAIIIDYDMEELLGNLEKIKIYGENPVWVFTPDGQALKQPQNKAFIFDPREYFSKGIQEVPTLIVLDNGMLMYQDLSLIPGQPLIRLAISIPSSLLFKDIRQVLRFLFIVFLLAVFTTSIVAYQLSRYLSRPIIELAHATVRFAKGELSTRVKVKTTGEVQMLVNSFNQMAEDLKKTTISKEELELQVRERTKQLLEAQKELVRKEKFATLGQLAGSVGHELRNPLGVISNAIYFLKTVMPEADETVKEYLNIIKNEVDNSQRIISALLDSTSTKMPRLQLIAANDLLKQALGKCSIPENIMLHIDISETLPGIKVDPLQMGQVFQNLITNAVQAMPNGGALRVSARQIADCGKNQFRNADCGLRNDEQSNDAVSPKSEIANPQSEIEISVTDTGEGISPENMEKLFHPLFTTKARGIGLGLTVSKNLIEANNGKIEMKSQLGNGTTFTVILPAEK